MHTHTQTYIHTTHIHTLHIPHTYYTHTAIHTHHTHTPQTHTHIFTLTQITAEEMQLQTTAAFRTDSEGRNKEGRRKQEAWSQAGEVNTAQPRRQKQLVLWLESLDPGTQVPMPAPQLLFGT